MKTINRCLSNSQIAMLEALRAALYEREPHFSNEIDWDEVIFEAKSQAIMGLVGSMIPVYDETIEQVKATYLKIMYEQDKVLLLLDYNSIPCVILKGSAASIYYPKPFLRSMGDIDILVPRNRFVEATMLLGANGYDFLQGEEVISQLSDKTREVAFVKNGIEIELHQFFSTRGYNVDDILEEAILRREIHILNGYRIPVLPELENGLVLLGHINQHLRKNVLGLRQIVDWAMYIHSFDDKEIWEERFVPIAKQIGLFSLASYVTQMCRDYLGLDGSYTMCSDVDKRLSDELMNIVLTDGNFGRRESALGNDNERGLRGAIYEIEGKGLFSYLQSVGLGTWQLCKKHPALRPVAFIYGFFRQLGKGVSLLVKGKHIGNEFDEGKRRDELYKIIGVKTTDL